MYTDFPIMEVGNIQLPHSYLPLLKLIPIIRAAPAILAPSQACVVKLGSEG